MRQQINLYRPDRRQRVALSSAALLRICAAFAGALLLVYAFGHYRLDSLERELDVIERQELAAIARLEALHPMLSAAGGADWNARLQAALATLEQKQAILQLLQGTAIGDTRGFSEHLRSLARQTTDGLWLTHIVLSASGDKTRLEGRALRAELVPTYVQQLILEQPFAAQRFHRFQIDGPEDEPGQTVAFSMDSENGESAARGR